MITLYQFPGIWGLPNASPYCLKVETYLRMVELPYEIKSVMDTSRAPKGKLPFIKIDGKAIPDSELIIDYLKAKYGDSLDKNLNKEQRALSVFLNNSLSNQLYWLMLYLRWQEDKGWAVVKEGFFAKLPKWAKLFVPNLVRKKMIKSLYLQGTGRYNQDEVLHLGYKIIDAIAVKLADKKYIHGDEPSTIDATVFAFLANIAWLPYEDSFKLYLHKHLNLLSYCDRMWNTFYPEMSKPYAIVG